VINVTMTCLYVGLIMAVWLTATRAVASELCQNMGSTTRKYTLNITAGYGSPGKGSFLIELPQPRVLLTTR
jgi:hypothetical protein